MVDIIAWVISLVLTLPLLSSIILLVFLRKVVKNKKRSFILAIDIATFFFIISVHFHLITIFEQSFLIFIILGLTILTITVYFVDYRRSKVPSIIKASKRVWRMSFLLFFVSYLVLTILGIVASMIKIH